MGSFGKRILSLALSLMMVIGVMVVGSGSIEASAYAPASEYPYSVAAGVYYVDAWNFYQCECTSFVAWCLNARNGVGFTNNYGNVRWGYANNWKAAAQSLGITVNGSPAVGSVAYSGSGGNGHVAWVTAVNGNGTVNIEEYNNDYVLINGEYHGNHKFNSRTVSTGSFEYIHIKDLPSNQAPIGYVDNIAGGLNGIYVSGWAFDPDSSNTSIGIHVYIGGPAGSDEGEPHNIGVADIERTDVNNQNSISGNHGFEATIITEKTGSQPIYIYALDANGNNNPCIGQGTVTIKSQSASTIDERKYYIESKIAPGKVLDVQGITSDNKANVHLFSISNNINQVFLIKLESDDYYSIRSGCSDYQSGLDVEGVSSKNRANIYQYEYVGQKNQKWKFYSTSDGYYYIMSGCGTFIDVSKGETADGSNIATWRYEDSNNLQFKLLNAYTISFNANGGSGAPGAKYKAQGYNLTLPSAAPTRNGYTFKGWSTNASASNAQYLPGTAFDLDNDTTLYAVWKSNNPEYTINYNANGGKNPPANQTGSSNITLSTVKPTRDGYTFKCWNTKSDGKGTSYNPGTSYSLTANVTLYAIWEQNPVTTFTLTYNANGGKNPPANQTGNGNIVLSSVKPTKDGYTFKSWNTKSDGKGTSYNPGAAYNLNANATLYAVWQEVVNNPTVGIKNFMSTRSEAYKTTITFTAVTTDAPTGSTVHWIINGKDVGTGDTYTVEKATSTYTVQTRLVSEDNKTLTESEIETVEINTGFFARIIAFFRGLFGLLPVIEQ